MCDNHVSDELGDSSDYARYVAHSVNFEYIQVVNFGFIFLELLKGILACLFFGLVYIQPGEHGFCIAQLMYQHLTLI